MELSEIDRQLFYATSRANLPVIRYLLRNGANIDAERCMDNLGCGYTPLTMSIMAGNVDVAR